MAMSPEWLALAREAGLASEHLGIGVTALGRANYAQPAYYSQAFFALSVGIERSGKLGLVVDHALDHDGAFPSDKTVRSYGHDLSRLLHLLDEVAERRGLSGEWDRLPDSNIHRGIIETLNEFARNITRYYNIEFVTGAVPPSVMDPVSAWFTRVTEPVLAAHDSVRRRQKREAQAALLEEMTGSFTLVRHHSETGAPISTVYDGALRTAIVDTFRPYERMYVLQIARFISSVLTELGYAAQRDHLGVPYLPDFFFLFRQADSYLRSRKTWSTYG
jgi:hypothetical protein